MPREAHPGWHSPKAWGTNSHHPKESRTKSLCSRACNNSGCSHGHLAEGGAWGPEETRGAGPSACLEGESAAEPDAEGYAA